MNKTNITKVLLATTDREGCKPAFDYFSMNEKFSLTETRDPADALLFMLENEVDLLIVDIDAAAGAAWLKAIKIARKMRPKVPCLVLSSNSDYVKTGAAAKEAGAYYCIVKPFGRDILFSAMEGALKVSRAAV